MLRDREGAYCKDFLHTCEENMSLAKVEMAVMLLAHQTLPTPTMGLSKSLGPDMPSVAYSIAWGHTILRFYVSFLLLLPDLHLGPLVG